MTLDIVQGGCATQEDSVRCLAKALSNETSRESKDKDERELDEYKRIEMGLKKYLIFSTFNLLQSLSF